MLKYLEAMVFKFTLRCFRKVTYIYTYRYMYTCLYVYIYMCVQIYMYIHIHVYVERGRKEFIKQISKMW